MGTADAFAAGLPVQFLQRDLIADGIEFFQHGPVAEIAVHTRGFQKSVQRFGCRVYEQPQNMDLLMVEHGRQFHAGDRDDGSSACGVKEFRQTRNGVVIGQRDRGQSGLNGGMKQCRGRVRTVGRCAVRVKIQHGTCSVQKVTASSQRSAIKACPAAVG